MSAQEARKDKSSAAFSSVVAAVGLTTFKLIVGLLTNSLGILAEAAHSALDMVAALMTYFAVRMSDKPADQEHPFGHGKIENISALFETLLLLVTSAWIIYEAIQRLFFHPDIIPEATVWSFIVMGGSIVVDFTRSRLLSKAARKYKSQALEADALHFSTDIWSSGVVILGLIGLSLARSTGLSWMHRADSVAALIVAVIVIYVSIQLGYRTISALLDTAPKGLAQRVEMIAAAVEGVVDAHAIRIRASGAHTFIDMHITMDGSCTLREAHAATEVIENAIRAVISPADITVHVEPAGIAQASRPPRFRSRKL